jgi:hypothetical protein
LLVVCEVTCDDCGWGWWELDGDVSEVSGGRT